MAVTLVSIPDLHALTKGGRMDFLFEGDGPFQTLGVSAVAVLFFSAPVADGFTLNLKWNGKTEPLVFKIAPSEANEFPIGDGSSDYVDELVNLLKGYYPIRKDFVVSRYDPTQMPGILLTARTTGKAYDLSVLSPPVGSPITIANQIFGADPIARVQYSIYAEVYLQKPGTDGSDLDAHYSLIYQAPIETDLQGQASFNVGNILHAELTPDWPTWSFLNPSGGSNSHRKYYIAYGEAWGSPLKVARMLTSPVRYAYLGGADFVHRASSGYFLNRFDSSLGANKALRFGAQTRYVLPDEPQFLTFINQRNTALSNLKLVCTLTYSDDSTEVIDTIYAPQSLPIGGKICFAVGATQLDLASRAGSKVLKEYAVKLKAGSSDWSITYRYILNANYQPYARHFVYLNSLGALETLTTFGKGSAELSIFSEQAERYLPSHYAVEDGQFVDYNLATQQQLEVATGFWPQAVLQTWNDFYRSPYKFRLLGQQALPIQLVSKSIKQAKDGDTLFAHSFTLVYANKDDFYTGQEADETGDGAPPLNFKMMGGTVVINTPPPPTRNIDDSIPDYIRSLTLEQVQSALTAGQRPNPATLGFLTQASGNQLYRRDDQPVDYQDLVGTPTTRDGLGLTDVPTKTEVESGTSAGLRKAVPEVDDAVETASALVVYQTSIAPDGKEYRVSAPMNFTIAANFILENATDAQLNTLLSRLKITLDQTLQNGNESDREIIVKESNRRLLTILPALELICGRVYDPVGKKYLERYASPADLALLLQGLFDMPTLAASLAPYLNASEGSGPSATDWIIDGDLTLCEDRWKEFDRDEIDNNDLQ